MKTRVAVAVAMVAAVVAALLPGAASAAPLFTLTGRVVDLGGVGQPNKTVRAGAAWDGTDSAGVYELQVPAGTWQVSTANGNRVAEVTVEVQTSPTVAPDIVLLDTPGAPGRVRASAGPGYATVTWDAPSNGGSPILGYEVVASPGGATCTTAPPAGEYCSFGAALATNRRYTFTVTATNAVGVGDRSAPSEPVTPVDPVPGAPGSVGTRVGDKSVTLTWSPPSMGAATVTGYRVESTPASGGCETSKVTCTITGLANGTSYKFRVSAMSTGGESSAVETKWVRPLGSPSAPRNVVVTPQDSALSVTWDPPLDSGGNTDLSYVATAAPGGQVCKTSSPPCTISGLRNGAAYTIQVKAVSTGSGLVSALSLPAVKATPNFLVKLKSSAKQRKVTVRWSTVGARSVTLRWERLTGTYQRVRKQTPVSGLKTLRGAPGTRWKVAVTAVSTAGTKNTVTKKIRTK